MSSRSDTGRRGRHDLDRLIGTSVRLNGLIVPAATLHSVLARYVENLFIWNDDPVFKVSLVGSAVPIHYSGRYYLVCSNHQLHGQQLENVSMMSRDGQHVITSSGVRHFSDHNDPHYLDLAGFDFTTPCRERPDLKERFFSLHSLPPDAPADDIAFAIVAGYPSQDQRYELEDANHIGRFKRIVVCQPEPSYNASLLCLRASEPLGFNPDGMSGGSAFVVQQVNGEFCAFFAGMVVTGGEDCFHIIKVGLIERFLRMLVERF